jgi:hypothetical protein
VAVTAALAAGANGDVEAVVAALRPVAAADPRWLDAFERYERLGFMPPGIRDLL